MINLVTLSSQRYLIDVGMGARGPIVPLPLISGASAFSISPRVVRMLHGCIPEHTTSHASNALWRLEVRNHERSQWKPTYAFSEIEFLPVDFEMMNWYINASPRSWFTQQVFVGRMVLDAQRMEVVGDITLFEKTLRRRIHGIVDLEVECQSERERVELLRKHFGIKLTEIDCTGIN